MERREKEKEAVKDHTTTITDHQQEEKVFRLEIKGDGMGRDRQSDTGDECEGETGERK